MRIEREMLEPGDHPMRSPCSVLAYHMLCPDPAVSQSMSWACMCIAEWAGDNRYTGTSEAFLKLGAYVSPANARYAVVVAYAMSARGLHGQAEHWFARAYRIAVWTDDWGAQVQVLTGWANLAASTGLEERADYFRKRASTVARRRGIGSVVEDVTHEELSGMSEGCE